MYYKDEVEDKDRIVTGWGASLSGIWQFAENTSLCFQGVYGKGISNYIQDISGSGLDLVPSATAEGKLKAFNAWGGYIGFSHNWSKVLTSNIMYSYARALDRQRSRFDRQNRLPVLRAAVADYYSAEYRQHAILVK